MDRASVAGYHFQLRNAQNVLILLKIKMISLTRVHECQMKGSKNKIAKEKPHTFAMQELTLSNLNKVQAVLSQICDYTPVSINGVILVYGIQWDDNTA